MKKITGFLFIIVLTFSFPSCKKDDSGFMFRCCYTTNWSHLSNGHKTVIASYFECPVNDLEQATEKYKNGGAYSKMLEDATIDSVWFEYYCEKKDWKVE